jgi:hypothetical protein
VLTQTLVFAGQCPFLKQQKLLVFNSMTTTYLTESQMENLMTECRNLRKGHKLSLGRRPYTVIVDGEHYHFSTTASLRKFLSCCVFPEDFRTFRNADKGVTINLD